MINEFVKMFKKIIFWQIFNFVFFLNKNSASRPFRFLDFGSKLHWRHRIWRITENWPNWHQQKCHSLVWHWIDKLAMLVGRWRRQNGLALDWTEQQQRQWQWWSDGGRNSLGRFAHGKSVFDDAGRRQRRQQRLGRHFWRLIGKKMAPKSQVGNLSYIGIFIFFN